MKQSKVEERSSKLPKSFDMSIGQKELWFIHSLGGLAKSAYNEPLIYTLNGYIKIKALKQAFTALLSKHEALRTFFKQDHKGDVYQSIEKDVTLDFSLLEITNKDEIDDYIYAFIQKPFNIEKPPLMRVSLIKKSKDQHILVIVMHHIITDGTSFGIFVKDLNALYKQLIQGDTVDSGCAAKQYQIHVLTEKENTNSSAYFEQVDNVAKYLEGYSTLNFLTTPIAEERRDVFSGNRVYFKLESELLSKMTEVTKQKRVTMFHLLYATFSLLVRRYTRSNDVVIGVPFANRQADPEQAIMGYFINMMPIRQQINDDITFLEYLVEVKTNIFTNLCRQNVAFEHVASRLKLKRTALGQHPLIQTLFVWGSTEKLQLKLPGIESCIEQQYHTHTSKFDISLFMLEVSKELVTGYFEFRDTLFEKDMLEAFKKSFTILLENIINNPESKISNLSLLNENEQEKVREKFFNAKLDRVVDKSLIDLFSETIQRFPNRIGLIYDSKCYDYETLEQKSNQWASYIRYQYCCHYGKELEADSLVALCVDRNEDLIFGILGILKSGAAYVPVDPQYPLERMNYILFHSQASLLLTHRRYDTLGLNFAKERIIYMDDELIKNSKYFVNQKPDHKIYPQDIAYVLYTSGSTGNPKGVAVTHENVNSLFASLDKQFDLSESDIWSLFHTFCFDISVWEIWGAFLYGGTLVVIPYQVTRDTSQFYELIRREKVTVLTQTASAFQMFINEDLKTDNKLNSLRYVGFVGESLKVSILRPWVKKYGTTQPQLVNLYGITETTVYTNYKFIGQHDIDKGRDNIGWPLEEFSMCILDEKNQWCPVGIVGEICIGGRGLSRGYLYRDDLTRERFIPDPYANYLGLKPGARLYRTGDLGRWMADGSIEYLGRKDFQVKLRGFRIELGEIEAALGSFDGITHTVALLKGEGESSYLSAYYTVKPGMCIDSLELFSHLKSFLPDYMVPAVVTELLSFPMTVNGKIDRQKLHILDDMKTNIKEILPLNSKIQENIASIWCEVLNVSKEILGANSNFFDLGGNSLLVVKMLGKISSELELECTLGRFITLPTISNLADQVEGQSDYKRVMGDFCEKLKNDCKLQSSIQPLPKRNNYITHPKTVLMTGATGFLGAYLLNELITASEADIICLVRADSREKALHKLVAKLEKYNLYQPEKFSRVSVVLGNLNLSGLGLSTSDYEFVAQNADSILHVGAWVHHVYDYQTLRQANVESVRDLLKLAVTVKNKALHFISTLAAGTISPLERLENLEADSHEAQLSFNGYVASKWVAEQLLQQANQRRIAAYVYRPGNIIASTQNPVYEPDNNHTLLRLKGMLQLGKGYVDEDEHVEMMPVDCLAKAIIHLCIEQNQACHNLNHSQTISWTKYLNLAQSVGFHFEFVDKENWNTLISQLDENNAFYKLSQFYKANGSGAIREKQLIKPSYIINTPSYEKMALQQLNTLLHCGFLLKPQQITPELLEKEVV